MSECSVCHVPYNEAVLPFPVHLSHCAVCRLVLLLTVHHCLWLHHHYLHHLYHHHYHCCHGNQVFSLEAECHCRV